MRFARGGDDLQLFACAGEMLAARGIGEQPVVANAVEAARQTACPRRSYKAAGAALCPATFVILLAEHWENKLRDSSAAHTTHYERRAESPFCRVADQQAIHRNRPSEPLCPSTLPR